MRLRPTIIALVLIRAVLSDLTVTLQVAETPPSTEVAVIVHVPASTNVTVPFSTVATSGSDVDQITSPTLGLSPIVLSAVTVAVSVCGSEP